MFNEEVLKKVFKDFDDIKKDKIVFDGKKTYKEVDGEKVSYTYTIWEVIYEANDRYLGCWITKENIAIPLLNRYVTHNNLFTFEATP